MPDFIREEVIEKVAAGEKIEHADLRGTDLSGAMLRKAYLRTANLRGADLSGDRCNKNTRFPEDFDPDNAWMTLVE